MDAGSLSKLLALLIAALVAVAVTWLLTRHERRPRRPRALLAGYPSDEFPHRDRVDGPLAPLCRSQSSLLALYASLPPSSPARAGLLVFLEELRALMDGAYELAAVNESPVARSQLERLVEGAKSATGEMMASTEKHLQSADGHGVGSDLDVRLDVLRALARNLDDP